MESCRLIVNRMVNYVEPFEPRVKGQECSRRHKHVCNGAVSLCDTSPTGEVMAETSVKGLLRPGREVVRILRLLPGTKL